MIDYAQGQLQFPDGKPVLFLSGGEYARATEVMPWIEEFVVIPILGGYVGLTTMWQTKSFPLAILSGALAVALIGLGTGSSSSAWPPRSAWPSGSFWKRRGPAQRSEQQW